uniref:Uncharacterized protein n=1 Tax=Entomoneis paludosa TaxID=265537 RepID=A0A7S2VFL2_9STRA|mmetsp:Transcript_18176/g.37574  ORF Transcript_18176/g.37574 Transcript_18176/m.37574 type:complete len:390 (+) Transcript_18176:248-1417(+)|eukprot:CAMPEP_0172445868 /NCGR_PEP_ID=MMETSP1065-20121228/5647_1 /TAXON_ID=265537 /ORGANISM="Amphiprora paludosa, Strain CCMP125" /LENGTH=389 /DNA_ID=CAMNT_0013196881 /DNA_START=134 /DNA_END=1303 /DNA_ORIENTATION=-
MNSFKSEATALNSTKPRPAQQQERLRKCSSALLAGALTGGGQPRPVDLEDSQLPLLDGNLYCWEKSVLGFRRAILRRRLQASRNLNSNKESIQSENAPSEAAEEITGPCSNGKKRARTTVDEVEQEQHVTKKRNTSTTASSPEIKSIPPFERSSGEEIPRSKASKPTSLPASTNELLSQVEEEIIRRVCGREDEPTTPCSHRPSWNPAEGGRIAQAFLVYGVPDTTEITKSLLAVIAEADSTDGSQSVVTTSTSMEDRQSLSTDSHLSAHDLRNDMIGSTDFRSSSLAPSQWSIPGEEASQHNCSYAAATDESDMGFGASQVSLEPNDCFGKQDCVASQRFSTSGRKHTESFGSSLLAETVQSPIIQDSLVFGMDMLTPINPSDLEDLF